MNHLNDDIKMCYHCVMKTGDWQVSILFEGDHIQGSPFNVRVYDPGLVKVSRLPTGFVGRPYEFSGTVSCKPRKIYKI